ncbi:hypothetical protein [Bacillus tuaregi]|uniref:hypothetical protein n=1 Tax=Bacillus tuaregi TaxID=1816695 RepID=UPI0008F7EAC1|nr:hypothetical protein [Bacillus tuaregi]
MIKRIVVTLLMLQILLFGPTSLLADAAGRAGLSANEKVEESQELEVDVQQEQSVETGGTAEEIEQNQAVTVEKSQEQTTLAEEQKETDHGAVEAENQAEMDEAILGYAIEDITDTIDGDGQTETIKDAADEPQTETIEGTEDKSQSETNTSTEAESSNGDNNEAAAGTDEENKVNPEAKSHVRERVGSSYEQEQIIEIIAEQKQKVLEANHVKAEQEQDLTVNYNQSVKVTKRDKQSQETSLNTNQEQFFITESQTDYMEQITETVMDTKQSGIINQDKNLNKAVQNTVITTSQKHTSETTGNAVIKQEQMVEAAANTMDKSRESASILAKAVNGVEMIKDAAGTAVKMVQSVIVNNQEIAVFEKEFTVGSEPVEHIQVFTQSFAWGTLSVLNKAIVTLTEDLDLNSVLESVIKLDFSLPIKKLFDNHSDASDKACPDSDGDGLTDCEERQNRDRPL